MCVCDCVFVCDYVCVYDCVCVNWWIGGSGVSGWMGEYFNCIVKGCSLGTWNEKRGHSSDGVCRGGLRGRVLAVPEDIEWAIIEMKFVIPSYQLLETPHPFLLET